MTSTSQIRPEKIEHIPKFALPPRLQPIDKLALVRNIVSKAQVENASPIINEGIDRIASQKSSATAGMSFRSTVKELINKGLNLCVSDKEGIFVVLDSDAYNERPFASMAKNFIHVDAKRNKGAKQAVLKLFDNSNLNSLCTKIRQTKKGQLQVFLGENPQRADSFGPLCRKEKPGKSIG